MSSESEDRGTEANVGNIAAGALKNVGEFFRYLLPGIVILVVALGSHPSWFKDRVNWSDPWNLAMLAALAVAAGSLWYAIHRHVVHQTIDCLLYALGIPGPCDKKPGFRALFRYTDAVSLYIVRSLSSAVPTKLRDHITIKAATNHFVFVAAEVLFVFSFGTETGSVLSPHWDWSRLLGFTLFGFALWQNIIVRLTDYRSVEAFGK